MNLGPRNDAPVFLAALGLAAAVAFGWSLASAVWLAPFFAALLLVASWRWARDHRHAAMFASHLTRSVAEIDTHTFRRPVSDRAPKELDRLASAMTEKNLQLIAAENENRRNRSSVRAVFAAVKAPLLLVDRECRVLMINQAVATAFQVTQAEASGSPFLQIVREHQIDDALARCMTEGVGQDMELHVMTSKPPGRYSVRIEPLVKGDLTLCDNPTQAPREATEPVEGAIVAMTDVTRLRYLERVRKEFVSNVSHELRTPITSIKGFVETLAGEDVPPETRTRFLAILKQEADRLDNLLTDLLDLSLLESDTRPLKREPVDLGRLAHRVVSLLEPQARRKQIRTAVVTPPDLPSVPAHPGMIEQALVNLVDNAIKYSPERGAVTIEGKRVGHDHVELAVIDNGPGIPSEHLPRLFERFYRVDKARSRSIGGTGLGLAIVRHIVQRHGGTVRAESRLGKGSRFVVTLPFAAEEAPVPTWDE